MYYPLPSHDSLGDLQSQITDGLHLHPEGQTSEHRQYFDTFDWRLFNQARFLVKWRSGAVQHLSLSGLDGKKPQWNTALPKSWDPFARNLAPGPLADELLALLDIRALLPLATVDSTVYAFHGIDSEGKTRLRLYLEEHCLSCKQEEKVLYRRIHIAPLRGYQKSADRVAKKIEKKWAVTPCKEDLFFRTMDAAGHVPGTYSTKLTIPIAAEERVDVAVRRILLHLLDAMDCNHKGTVENLDSEFLHDFRVAIRRTRSMLSQVKIAFSAEILAQYKKEFAQLGTLTGPTRDLDVYLLHFPTYQSDLPADLQTGLVPLQVFLAQQQQQAQKTLAVALRAPAYQKLIKQWRQYLTSAVPTSTATGADQPVLDVANRRIWRVYRSVVRAGRAIDEQTPAEVLHELRKTCKKLRYLMEFFQELYAKKKIRSAIAMLKNLQENLGDFQDLEVQINSLSHFSEQMEQAGMVTFRSHLATGALLRGLYDRMAQVRTAFADRFCAFDQRHHRELFITLFKPSPAKGVVA